MSCPDCGAGMVEEDHHGVTLDRCPGCGGLWFDIEEIHGFLEAHPRIRPTNLPSRAEFLSGTRGLREPCPCCRHPTVEYGQLRGIGYRHCTWCGGVFLERHKVAEIVRSRPGRVAAAWGLLVAGPEQPAWSGAGALDAGVAASETGRPVVHAIAEPTAHVVGEVIVSVLEFVLEAVFGSLF